MKMKTVRTTVLTLAILLGALVTQPVSTARADLLIMPIRTVFTDRDRMKTLTVVNTANKAATFRLSFYYQRQTADGSYINQENTPLDPKYDIAKMITFSPRQVNMAPNASQVVRLSLRGAADLPDGEYRVHLKLQRLSGGVQQAPVKQPNGITTQLTINVGFSVPIIIRKGKNDATATISEPKLLPPPEGRNLPMMSFFLDRKGKYSTLGKVDIFWTPKGGQEKQVGVLNDVNVFAETPRRQVMVSLNESNISGGTFRIVYAGDDADKGRKFDEKTFPVGG
jgi:hypothetical protein